MLVFTNTHMLKKIKNLREQNFKGTVTQPTVKGKELTSGQKEKPQGKKKNLRGKRKTSCESSFCREVFLSAVRFILP